MVSFGMKGTARARFHVACALSLALLAGCGDTIVQEVVDFDAGGFRQPGDGDGDTGGDGDPGDGDTGDGDMGDGDTVDVPVGRPCETDGDCDNGLFCDGAETCVDNACVFAEAVDCNDNVECTRDRCSDELARCVHFGPDADGDGHIDASCVDADGLALGDDCDDTDSNRFPGNIEFCDDGHDEDCDLQTLGIRDMDRDSFVDALCCNAAGGERYCGDDCDDSSRGVNPIVPEVCDGVDNDCDMEADEGVLESGYPDRDKDNYGDMNSEIITSCKALDLADDNLDCDDGDINRNGGQAEICDQIDNDCDGIVDEMTVAVTWYFDLDGDGFGSIQSGTAVSCAPIEGASLLSTDCNDNNPNTYPGAEELCDARDNDCNGVADYLVGPGNSEDDDGDGSPDPLCLRYPEDCNDDDDDVYPGAIELCDGIDNDCNGLTDTNVALSNWFKDEDGDGWGDNDDPGIISCEELPGRTRMLGDCDDLDGARNPDRNDNCQGRRNIDDDCDGQVDEAENASPFYPDLDGDGFGNGLAEPFLACSAPDGYSSTPSDCNDGDIGIAPGADEKCAERDGIDNDCDTTFDCEDTDCQNVPECASLYSLSLKNGDLPPGFICKESTPVTIVVKDPQGNPVIAGLEVTFTASEGAVVSPTTAMTDDNGEVAVQIRPGRLPATYTFTAKVSEDGTLLVFGREALRPPKGTIYSETNVGHTQSGATPQGPLPPAPATTAATYIYGGVFATAADGTIYQADHYEHRVYAISPRGERTVVAGTGGTGNRNDGQPALDADLYYPFDVALDEDRGYLYIAQLTTGALHARIRVLDLDSGLIGTYAGGNDGLPNEEPYGDGASATQAILYNPRNLQVLPDGQLLFVDRGNRFRTVDRDSRIIDTVLSPGSCSGGADFEWYSCGTYCNLILDEDGVGAFLTGNFCGREVNYNNNGSVPAVAYIPDVFADEWTLHHVGGRYQGDSGGTAQESEFRIASGVATDPAGNVFIAERDRHRIRRIDAQTTLITTVVGTGTYNAQVPPDGDYGPALNAELYNPEMIEFNDSLDLRIADYDNRSLRVAVGLGSTVPTKTAMTTVLGESEAVLPGQQLAEPFGVRVSDPDTDEPLIDVPVFFRSDQESFFLPSSEGTTDIGGVLAVSGRAGIVPGAYKLTAWMEDIRGNLLHDEELTVTVARPPSGALSTIVNAEHIAGNVIGPSTRTRLYYPWGLAPDSLGGVYIADYYRHVVRYLTPEGVVVNIAGTGSAAYDGDGGEALSARLYYPRDVVIDEARQLLYIIDGNNHVIRVVDLITGLIDTFAGTGASGTGTAGEAALNFAFQYPSTGHIGPDGDLYITDNYNDRIVRMPLGTSPGNRIVEEVIAAGSCPYPYTGELVLWDCNSNCMFDWAANGDMILHGRFCGLGQYNQNMVVKVDANDQSITPIAGWERTNSGFGSMPVGDAQINRPGGLVVDGDDHVWVADYDRHTVRYFENLDGTGQITTVIGTGVNGCNDDPALGEWEQAATRNICNPYYMIEEANGDLLISAHNDHAIYRYWK